MDERLSAPLSVIKGAGPRRIALLEKLGLRTIYDLLFFFPRKYENRRNVRKISALVPGAPSVVIAQSRGCEARALPGRGRRLIKCRFSDGSGLLNAVWFNIKGLENSLGEGTRAALCGVPSLRGGVFEMLSPEFEILKEGAGPENFTGIVPVYPLTAGLPKNWLRRAVTETVKSCAVQLSVSPMEEIRALCEQHGVSHLYVENNYVSMSLQKDLAAAVKPTEIVADDRMEFNVLCNAIEEYDPATNTKRDYQWRNFFEGDKATQNDRRQMHTNDIDTSANDFVEVCLDYRQTGVGGYDSWGSRPEARFTLRTDASYEWGFTLDPR